MKTWKLLWLLLIPAAVAVVPMARNTRSVRLISQTPAMAMDGPFDPKQSVGVFVGARTFTDSALAPVPYAVDDAIDLAYLLAIEGKAPLVRPDRIILLLAGKPHKHGSAEWLDELKAAGAIVHGAGQADI